MTIPPGFVAIPTKMLKDKLVTLGLSNIINDAPPALVIGCGQVNSPGMVRIDARWPSEAHILMDVAELDRVWERTFQKVFCKYVIEHLPRTRWLPFLRAVWNVLQPGGTFEAIVPHMPEAVAQYCARERDQESLEDRLFGNAEPDNVLMRHKSFTGPDQLAPQFEATGFEAVQVKHPHPGPNDVWIQGRRPTTGDHN